jgi:hypothetical protein
MHVYFIVNQRIVTVFLLGISVKLTTLAAASYSFLIRTLNKDD